MRGKELPKQSEIKSFSCLLFYRALSGSDAKDGKFGTAFNFFQNPEEGAEACVALDELLEAGL